MRAPVLMLAFAVASGASAAADVHAKAKKDKTTDKATDKAVPAKAIVKASYGKVDGKSVDLYTLTNASGAFAKITNYGAIVTELHVPDKAGKLGDVVLGFDNVDDYVKKSPYFGAIVGRVANRIKDATFELDGKTYKLNANDAPHHLHGGKKGWDKVIWKAEGKETPAGPSLVLTHVSPDGEENYPGTVTATAIYTLTNDNELKVDMTATTDKTTLVNMAHHTYWNLAGGGTILDHVLTMPADKYTPGPANPDGKVAVPDGKVVPVKGTPFDFTVAKPIGKDLNAAGGKPVGYDHNWVVNGDAKALRMVATLKDPKSGRVLTISADQPALQFYSGNFMDGKTKGKGVTHVQYAGLCLESQKSPNSVNVPAWRAEVVLKPGQTYKHTMVHKFTTE
jgi:aldose 1-epimerase